MADIQGELAPGRARDAAEFIALMRLLKERSGFTYRQLEERAAAGGGVLARSTLAGVLGGRTLPRPELLAVFVRACGDGERVADWLAAWTAVASAEDPARPSPAPPLPEAGAPPPHPHAPKAGGAGVASGQPTAGQGEDPARPAIEDRGPGRSPVGGRRRRWWVVTGAAAALAAVAATLAVATKEDAEQPAGARKAPALPTGWVNIVPLTGDGLCLTDGRVADGRYTPLVAVQRPCARAGPQTTLLEPMGRDLYQIQWHHPDYGKGCLRALPDGAGKGLLEPMDDCTLGSRFHVEPSGPRGSGRYVLRVDGQGCVGIKGDAESSGTEAVMGQCVGRDGQLFAIEPAN
ncbi:hypothetical protein LG634_17270 [Streptomyces bambusae]|uniref:RICIN domain-containing protein n=1 Tax=Streptomyces bambusae TaxID=1550616 RepID=UPI001CFED2C6|nr:hypothetical protein [Streptomyces bambusae]MCB5166581.1 hypothetical protein [Streptomyces bambusae]